MNTRRVQFRSTVQGPLEHGTMQGDLDIRAPQMVTLDICPPAALLASVVNKKKHFFPKSEIRRKGNQ